MAVLILRSHVCSDGINHPLLIEWIFIGGLLLLMWIYLSKIWNMSNEPVAEIVCKSKGLVFGTAIPGSYNSPMFKHDDIPAKVKAIYTLLNDCASTVAAEELCGSGVKKPGYLCLPSTLQSAGNDDADLTLNGPDDNGNCYYNVVITGKGLVGWSAVEDTCTCIPFPFK